LQQRGSNIKAMPRWVGFGATLLHLCLWVLPRCYPKPLFSTKYAKKTAENKKGCMLL
jgi:hypothetical protein